MIDKQSIILDSDKVKTGRQTIKGHNPLVLWFTGLSGSGKSSIAQALEWCLIDRYAMHTCMLDGDEIRRGLNKDLGFSPGDRSENIRRIGEVAQILYGAGLIVLVAVISPFRADRDRVRGLFPPGRFWELYVDCPIDICQSRDPKGLYQQAVQNQISEFTGISSPYEPPIKPEAILHTDTQSIHKSVDQIIALMLKRHIILNSTLSLD